MLIARLAVLAGASKVLAFDKFDWRLRMARDWGATHAFDVDACDPAGAVMAATGGHGVDVAIEAAWADHSVQQAAAMARYGGRLVLVGIPPDDNLQLQHSVARRKGLTIMMSRRMKHTYPRAIALATSGKVKLEELVSHRFDLVADGAGLREQSGLRAGHQQGDSAGGELAGFSAPGKSRAPGSSKPGSTSPPLSVSCSSSVTAPDCV